MSGAVIALQEAALARVEGVSGLCGVYEAPPGQAAFPYAVVEAGPETDWGHKTAAGSEIRLTVTVRAAGERPGRLYALLDAARARLEAGLAVADPSLVSFVWQRTRTAREAKPAVGADTLWTGELEFRARMLRSM